MTTPPSLAIHVATEKDRMVVSPLGEIDYGNVAELRSKLLEIAKKPTGPVVVDLSDVTFLDSTALSVLVQAKQRLIEQDKFYRQVDDQQHLQ